MGCGSSSAKKAEAQRDETLLAPSQRASFKTLAQLNKNGPLKTEIVEDEAAGSAHNQMGGEGGEGGGGHRALSRSQSVSGPRVPEEGLARSGSTAGGPVTRNLRRTSSVSKLLAVGQEEPSEKSGKDLWGGVRALQRAHTFTKVITDEATGEKTASVFGRESTLLAQRNVELERASCKSSGNIKKAFGSRFTGGAESDITSMGTIFNRSPSSPVRASTASTAKDLRGPPSRSGTAKDLRNQEPPPKDLLNQGPPGKELRTPASRWQGAAKSVVKEIKVVNSLRRATSGGSPISGKYSSGDAQASSSPKPRKVKEKTIRQQAAAAKKGTEGMLYPGFSKKWGDKEKAGIGKEKTAG